MQLSVVRWSEGDAQRKKMAMPEQVCRRTFINRQEHVLRLSFLETCMLYAACMEMLPWRLTSLKYV